MCYINKSWSLEAEEAESSGDTRRTRPGRGREWMDFEDGTASSYGTYASSMPSAFHESAIRRESFMTEVAMIVVAVTHICTFFWLLFLRSSHGILCAFGSSISLAAALLWWFLSHQGTPDRIRLQTIGLALTGEFAAARA